MSGTKDMSSQCSAGKGVQQDHVHLDALVLQEHRVHRSPHVLAEVGRPFPAHLAVAANSKQVCHRSTVVPPSQARSSFDRL